MIRPMEGASCDGYLTPEEEDEDFDAYDEIGAELREAWEDEDAN